MKTRLLIIFAIGILGFSTSVFAFESDDPDPLELWASNELIIDGTVIEVDTERTFSEELIRSYQIKVHEYFKGSHKFDLVYAQEPFSNKYFKTGERVLFYLYKDNSNSYQVHPSSLKTFENCNARDLIEISPVLPNEKHPISTPVLDEDFIDSCIPYYYYDVDPDFGGVTIYPAPIKQVNAGIESQNVQCQDPNKTLVLKIDGSPACVKSETKTNLMQRGWAVDPVFYELTKSQITDIQLAKFGCKKLGNPTYCDTMVQEKIEYYLQQNKLNAKLEPEPKRETTREKNLIDANNKLREIYQINPSLGPFHFQDVIVGHGIGDGYLIVDVLEKFYHSVDDRELIIQKIVDITNEKVDIDFSPSDGITPKDTESIFQYVWNSYLHKNHIQFSPQERSYVNTDEEYHYEKDNKVCSPLISSSGTEFYISSTFTDEPFKITGTLIDEIKPNDCQKIWKTDTVLLEPNKILGVWMNDFFNDSRNTVLFADYSVTEIGMHYSVDELVTFEFTETGFGDPCIPIKIVYYQDKTWIENIVLIDKIIRDCPAGKGDEFLSSTFDTSKDTEFGKSGDWVNFSVAGEYFVEITNENQPDGKIVASFQVG